jgi:hypothetical protein
MPSLLLKKFGSLIGGTTNRYKVLAGIALNAAEAARTVTLDVHDMAVVSLGIVLTHTAATDLQVAPYVSFDGGTTWVRRTSTSVAAGTGTISEYTDVFAVDGNEAIEVAYDVRTADKLKLVISGTSGGAADLIDVYATAAVGQ